MAEYFIGNEAVGGSIPLVGSPQTPYLDYYMDRRERNHNRLIAAIDQTKAMIRDKIKQLESMPLGDEQPPLTEFVCYYCRGKMDNENKCQRCGDQPWADKDF